MATPQHFFFGPILNGTAVGQSANISVPISVNGFQAEVMFRGVQPNTANISAGWECYAYATTDGGASYATVASFGGTITRNPNTPDNYPFIALPSGQWCLRLISGGGVASTYSFSIGTCDLITAIA